MPPDLKLLIEWKCSLRNYKLYHARCGLECYVCEYSWVAQYPRPKNIICTLALALLLNCAQIHSKLMAWRLTIQNNTSLDCAVTIVQRPPLGFPSSLNKERTATTYAYGTTIGMYTIVSRVGDAEFSLANFHMTSIIVAMKGFVSVKISFEW